MGIYLNPNNIAFKQALNSEIYIDKSLMLEQTNRVIYTEQKFICVSRPRRFGKSMAANMLTAYYSRGCDSRELFADLKIAQSDSFEKHLNQYNVIHINMVDFLDRTKSMDEMIDYISRRLLHELKKAFSDVDCFDWNSLFAVLDEVFAEKEIPFIFIIDEWDCIFRIHKNDSKAQTKYLDFLRNLLKDKSYVALAYMTGILPIKKYGEHSALNIFTEISMTNPREYAEFTGFTEKEVKELCEKYDMSFEETKRWYNGYNLKGISIYNPRSVVMSMTGHDYDSYWTSTETYEALRVYIAMNFDGLKDDVIKMLAGDKVKVNTDKFQNDLSIINSRDDALTSLIHLGYLGYDARRKQAFIPNYEVKTAFHSALETGKWSEVAQAIGNADELLFDTIDGYADSVAEKLDVAHEAYVSILQYNNENSLSCLVKMAYTTAPAYYNIEREFPAGKGFADMVFIPRKDTVDMPAILIELKYDKSADTAIKQIKEKRYAGKLSGYADKIMLVGVNYDKTTKKHECVIEEYYM